MSYLGRYLYSLRVGEGFESVADYLREKNLPISEPYYRALESGKKSGREITMSTAERLCESLGADAKQFYLHLLKDLLPERIFDTLVRPLPLQSFGSLEERQRLLAHDLAIYKEAFAKARLAESFVPDERAIRIFIERPELLPLLHFIYLVNESNFDQLQSVMERNGIKEDLREVIDLFSSLEIIKVEDVGEESGGVVVKRYRPTFRLPINELGSRLKKIFVLEETNVSLQLARGAHPFLEDESFVEAKIESYDPADLEKLRGRVFDFLAETVAAAGAQESGNQQVYFVSVMISPRPNYRA